MKNKILISKNFEEPNYSYAQVFNAIEEAKSYEYTDNTNNFKTKELRCNDLNIDSIVKSIEKWLDKEECTKKISKALKTMARKVALTYIMENKNPYNELLKRNNSIVTKNHFERDTLNLLNDKLEKYETFYFIKKHKESFLYENDLLKLDFSIDKEGIVHVSEFLLYPNQKEKKHIQGYYNVTTYFDGLNTTNFINQLKRFNLNNIATDINQYILKIKYYYVAQPIIQKYIAYLIMQNSNETMGASVAMLYASDINDINQDIKNIPMQYGLNYTDVSDIETYNSSISKQLISLYKLLKGDRNIIVFPSYYDERFKTKGIKVDNFIKIAPKKVEKMKKRIK